MTKLRDSARLASVTWSHVRRFALGLSTGFVHQRQEILLSKSNFPIKLILMSSLFHYKCDFATEVLAAIAHFAINCSNICYFTGTVQFPGHYSWLVLSSERGPTIPSIPENPSNHSNLTQVSTSNLAKISFLATKKRQRTFASSRSHRPLVREKEKTKKTWITPILQFCSLFTPGLLVKWMDCKRKCAMRVIRNLRISLKQPKSAISEESDAAVRVVAT